MDMKHTLDLRIKKICPLSPPTADEMKHVGQPFRIAFEILSIAFVTLVLIGCKMENLLSIDTDLPKGTGASNLPTVVNVIPGNRQELLDDNPDTAKIQATVVVTFSDFIDENSITGNVTVKNTTTGDLVPNLNITYNKEARKLYIRSNYWPESSSYLLTLISDGIKNRFGIPLDGNSDGENDGTTYDDFLTTFFTSGSRPESCVATRQPRIFNINPDTIRIIQPRPTITITFSTSMDSSTLIPDNFKLTTAGGTSVPIDTTLVSQTQISFIPRDSLVFGSKYFFTVKSNNVKAKYLRNTPDYLKTLDGDYDGPEASEPDFVWYFLVDTLPPPTVTSSVRITNGVGFNFSKRMDLTSLTTSNIKVFDATGYVPGSLVISHPAPGNYTRVEYYFERRASGTLRVFVAKEVKSDDGRMLDNNNNGIGGEIGDDYWRNI